MFLGTFVERMEHPQCFARMATFVAAVALTTRLVMFISFWPAWIWQSGQIQDDWNKLAINWVVWGTFGFTPDEPTIQRGPMFPLLEVPLYLTFGEHYAAWSIALLLFDTGTGVLLMMLGRKLWGDRAALLAGLFHAVHLPVIYYTAGINQFTTVLPLVFIWFYLISAWDLGTSRTRHYVALGLVAGMLILSKVVYLPVVIGSAGALGWLHRKQPDAGVALRRLCVALLIAATVVAPWTYRNYLVTDGRFIPVQSLFWEAVWQKFVILELDAREGWNRPAGRTLEYILARQKDLMQRLGKQKTPTLRGPQRELYYETAFRGEVLEWIRVNPAAYVRNLLNNTWYFWAGAENLKKTLLMAAMQTPLLGAAIVGLWLTIRHREVAKLRFGLVLILILWAEHTIVFGWGRYSLDTVPVLAFIVGTGIDAWLKFRRCPPAVTTSPAPSGSVSDLGQGRSALNEYTRHAAIGRCDCTTRADIATSRPSSVLAH